jgi:hypothetical protein
MYIDNAKNRFIESFPIEDRVWDASVCIHIKDVKIGRKEYSQINTVYFGKVLVPKAKAKFKVWNPRIVD